jgi:hypothetical protein
MNGSRRGETSKEKGKSGDAWFGPEGTFGAQEGHSAHHRLL